MRNKPIKILLVCLYVSGSLILGADNPKTLLFNNTPLKNALEKITDEIKVNFVYADEIVEGIKVNGKYTFSDIKETIQEILKNTNVKIGIYKNQLMVLVKSTKLERKINIIGSVYDSHNGETLPYANVTILESGIAAVTDKNGAFEFLNIPAGLITLKAKYLGYSEFVYFVNLDSLRGKVSLPLSRSSFKLKNIVIIDKLASITEIGKNVSQLALSSNSLGNFPIVGQSDVFKCLKLLPGISGDASGNSEMRIRGGFAFQNQIVIDGINLYHSDYLLGLYSTVPMEVVKDIRVYKSGYDARFGGKIAGVIDITTKTGNTKELSLTTEVNSLGIGTTVEIPISGRLSLIASGRKMVWSNNVENVYKDISLSKRNKTYYIQYSSKPVMSFYDMYLKLTYLPQGESLFNASFFSTYDNSEILFSDDYTNDILDLSGEKIEMKNSQKRRNTGGSINWFYKLNDNFKFNSGLSFSNYNADELNYDYETFEDSLYEYIDEIKFNSNNELKNLFYKFNSSVKLDSYLEFKTGLEYQSTKINYTAFEEINGDVAEAEMSEKIELSTFYLQNIFKPDKYLTVSPGLRFTYSSASNKVYFEPRILLNASITENFNLKGSYGRYNQFVIKNSEKNNKYYFINNWVVADESNFKPSFSEHYVAGFSYNIFDLVLDVEYYYINKQNIFPAYFSSKYNFWDSDFVFNDYNGFSKGVEIQLIKNKGNFTGWINYTYNHSIVDLELIGISKPLQDRGISPHLFNFVLNYNSNGWNFSSTFIYGTGAAIYVDGDYLDTFDNIIIFDDENYFFKEILPDHSRWDLAVRKTFKSNLFDVILGISIHNVMDKKNIWERNSYWGSEGIEKVDYKGFGRTFSFNAKLEL